MIDFKTLTEANRKRQADHFQAANENYKGKSWSVAEWGNAIAGEVGELCNLLKKKIRGDEGITDECIGDEMADVVIYLDLLAEKMKIPLWKSIVRKFNKSSQKIGSTVKIQPVSKTEYNLCMAQQLNDDYKEFLDSEGLTDEFQEFLMEKMEEQGH